MPKQVPQEDLILEIIGRFEAGASVEEILLGLSPPPTRRTLQYRLAILVESQRLVATGRTRGKKYHLPAQEATRPRHLEELIPLPPIALKIQAEVSRPIQVLF